MYYIILYFVEKIYFIKTEVQVSWETVPQGVKDTLTACIVAHKSLHGVLLCTPNTLRSWQRKRIARRFSLQTAFLPRLLLSMRIEEGTTAPL